MTWVHWPSPLVVCPSRLAASPSPFWINSDSLGIREYCSATSMAARTTSDHGASPPHSSSSAFFRPSKTPSASSTALGVGVNSPCEWYRRPVTGGRWGDRTLSISSHGTMDKFQIGSTLGPRLIS